LLEEEGTEREEGEIGEEETEDEIEETIEEDEMIEEVHQEEEFQEKEGALIAAVMVIGLEIVLMRTEGINVSIVDATDIWHENAKREEK